MNRPILLNHTRLFLFALFLGAATCFAPQAWSAEPAATPDLANLAYKSGDSLDAYEKERCQIDLFLPAGGRNFPTLVWFHGGSLKGGNKHDPFTAKIARSLADGGLAVAAVNYRLYPKVKFPGYLEDAAAAAAWVKAHIAAHGGDPRQVFISGHSAGGYLTFMLALDAGYLEKSGARPGDFAGFIPVSGQTVTHSTVREERGIPRQTIVVDAAAPLYHVQKATPPILILAADADLAGRMEENQLLYAALKGEGNPHIAFHVLAGRDHGSIAGEIAKHEDPARKLILDFTLRRNKN